MSKELEAFKVLEKLYIEAPFTCEIIGENVADIVKKALEERDMYFKALCDIESGENVRKVLERTLT